MAFAIVRNVTGSMQISDGLIKVCVMCLALDTLLLMSKLQGVLERCCHCLVCLLIGNYVDKVITQLTAQQAWSCNASITRCTDFGWLVAYGCKQPACTSDTDTATCFYLVILQKICSKD